MTRILVVEDEESFSDALSYMLISSATAGPSSPRLGAGPVF